MLIGHHRTETPPLAIANTWGQLQCTANAMFYQQKNCATIRGASVCQTPFATCPMPPPDPTDFSAWRTYRLGRTYGRPTQPAESPARLPAGQKSALIRYPPPPFLLKDGHSLLSPLPLPPRPQSKGWFGGPQARRCIHKVVHTQGGAHTKRYKHKAVCGRSLVT